MVIRGQLCTIRSIDESAIDEVFQVYRQCEDFLSLGPVPHASKQMVLDDFRLSREEGGTFCGVFVDDEMVGVADFVLSNYDGNPNEAYLALLMIAAPHRRGGLGQDVVRAVEAEILKNPCIKAIRAGVQVNNPSAAAFWQSMGYRIVGGPRLMPDSTTVYDLRRDTEQLVECPPIRENWRNLT